MYAKKLICLLLVLATVCASFTACAKAIQVEFLPGENPAADNRVPEKVPLYNQLDYQNTPFGNYGTIATHGCGVACLAMVTTYLQDKPYLPDDAAKDFGAYNTENGSLWTLFEESAETLALALQERTWKTEDVTAALENGQVVISLQNKGLFTGSGHFIVLTGLTEDGKILVNDPNGKNYTKNETLETGFRDGFTPTQIFAAGGPYWIYAAKETQNSAVHI